MRPDEPVDPDVDISVPEQLFEIVPREWDILAVIAIGGILGAEARYGLARAIVRPVDGFPWATLITNVLGSLLIGLLMVIVLDVLKPTRLVRPFLGVGVLGGFTTFSTFGVETHELLRAHRYGIGAAYVAASLLLCTLATFFAIAATTRAARR